MSPEMFLWIGLGIVAAWFVYWLVRLIWFKPLNIHHFYTRTFLKFALESPELLTMLGMLERLKINIHNSRLADESEAKADKTYQWLHKSYSMLRSYDRQKQKPGTLLSTDILDRFLGDQVAGEKFRYHNYPLNQMFGAQSQFPDFMANMHPIDGMTNARNYIKRLRRAEVKFDQILEGLKIRESKGIIPPKFVIRRVLDEMIAFVNTPAAENVLYTVYKDKIAARKFSLEDQAELLEMCEKAIEAYVYPIYLKMIAYFTTLEVTATTDDGVWKLPDGDNFYAYELRTSTTTDLTPGEVHEIGLAEVVRIEAEMGAILAALGYPDANIAEQMLAFAGEERFLYPNTDEGRAAALAEYTQILVDVDALISPLFDLRPKTGMKVERIPEFKEKTSPGAYYQIGSLDGRRPGVFYANLRDMKEVPKFGMKTLSYHEGIPGHHFQLSIAHGLKKLPLFRRMLPFTAYAEGWALYAEKLAREYGAYKDDPYGELGYLSSELFRAVRLVVDTGLHHARWTREGAIEYMQAHTGQALESIVSEVERYIVMPGQACSYKIGEIEMVRMRTKAQAALGDRFDIRKFHNVILGSGAMPLAMLEKQVDGYIVGG